MAIAEEVEPQVQTEQTVARELIFIQLLPITTACRMASTASITSLLQRTTHSYTIIHCSLMYGVYNDLR